MQDVKFNDRKAELENAMVIMRGLLSYHERMCLVADVEPGFEKCPFDLKDVYRAALKTSLEVLEAESRRC